MDLLVLQISLCAPPFHPSKLPFFPLIRNLRASFYTTPISISEIELPMIAKAYADQHQLKNPTQETPHTLSCQYSYGLSHAKYFVEEDYAQRLTCRYVWFSTRGLLPNLKVETNRKALRRNQKNPIPNERETRERERERDDRHCSRRATERGEERRDERERERE